VLIDYTFLPFMTQKQSSSLHNGRCHPLCDRRKRARFAATSSQCWSFFL